MMVTTTSTGSHLIARVGHTRVAIDNARVEAIVDSPPVTSMPLVPSPIAGLTAHRDEVVVVVDLRLILGSMEEIDESSLSTVVFVETERALLGLVIDAEMASTDLDRASIQPAPVTMLPIARRIVDGIGRVEGELVAVLDLEAIWTGVVDAGDDMPPDRSP